MKLYSVLITGANRGIGFELTRQLACSNKPPKHVFATYRNEETTQKLKEIQNSASPETKLHLVKMDVRNQSDVENARKIIEESVGENGLTVLINNAGAVQRMAYPDVTPENLLFHFNVNAVGPIMIAQAMLPLLKKASSLKPSPGMTFSKAGILNISSAAGSMTNVGVLYPMDLVAPGYKISKAALNMGMRVLSAVIKDNNILIVNMCPGWVKTDMGSDEAELLPQESVASILQTISTLNETHHGTYMDRLGKPYGW